MSGTLTTQVSVVEQAVNEFVTMLAGFRDPA
jgi:hypothetical protein